MTSSECVAVALVIQIARHTRRIMSSSVACVAVPFASTLSHHQQQQQQQQQQRDSQKKSFNTTLFSLQLFVFCISHSKN
jgi:hypothetical protein